MAAAAPLRFPIFQRPRPAAAQLQSVPMAHPASVRALGPAGRVSERRFGKDGGRGSSEVPDFPAATPRGRTASVGSDGEEQGSVEHTPSPLLDKIALRLFLGEPERECFN
ncbi:hypothetical protein NDU88_000723 [Pleurodeles waltl]|uniref:Uncharacterized protein n=1 Tax=Pleurodeles waltl TaxID=8319 RepID=A0AAV7P1Q2_PLEWA|nr:hypothetical protein NDU88_000723 [Pleurodeles waltl]